MITKSSSTAIIPRRIVDQIKGALKDSPVKEKDTFLLKEAIAEMLPEIEEMIQKGYSYDEIAALFSDHAVEVKGATLKKYCSELRKTAAPAKGTKVKSRKAAVQDTKAAAVVAVQASEQRKEKTGSGSDLGTTELSRGSTQRKRTSTGEPHRGFVEMPDVL
jgi:hypothetical protein